MFTVLLSPGVNPIAVNKYIIFLLPFLSLALYIHRRRYKICYVLTYSVPWGRISPWKWVPGISPGAKAACLFGWRPNTLVVPKVVMIRGLNLPGTPRATSACRGIPVLTYSLTDFEIRDIYSLNAQNDARFWLQQALYYDFKLIEVRSKFV